MTKPERWGVIERLYHAALERDADSRAAFLDEACAGDEELRREVAGLLAYDDPEDTLINELWLPSIRAALELQKGNAAQAIQQLQTAARHETAAEFWPPYLRGQAYVKLGRGAAAATEFQNILDHRGQAPLSVLYPLAHFGSARAAALVGDAAKSRRAYEDLFAVYKTADPDLPILIEAKRQSERR